MRALRSTSNSRKITYQRIVVSLLFSICFSSLGFGGTVEAASPPAGPEFFQNPGSVQSGSQEEGSGGVNFRGLAIQPLNSSELTVSSGSERLLVAGAPGEDAEAKVLTGEVGSLKTIFARLPHVPPPGSGLQIEAEGRASGQDAILGNLLLEEIGGVFDVTPSFAGVGASTYELTLLSSGTVILELSSRSGIAGQVSLDPTVGPTVEWFSGSEAIMTGFSSSFGFKVEGLTYSADQVVFRAESPNKEGEYISSVDWRGMNLNQFAVQDIAFDLEGVGYRLSGPLSVSPANGILGVFSPDQGGEWAVDVDVSDAAVWEIGVEPDALSLDAALDFRVLASYEVGEPGEWKVELARRSSEPMMPTAWRALFDFQPFGAVSIRVMNDGVLVGTLNNTSTEAVYFEPNAFEVRMEFLPLIHPVMSLSFENPTLVTLAGGASMLGDQILAGPSNPLGEVSVLNLSDVRISGVGQGQVEVKELKVQLEEKRDGVFRCGGRVRMEVCRPPDSGKRTLEFQIFVEAPPGKSVCFEIESPTPKSSPFQNLRPTSSSSPNQVPPFRWMSCLRSGTSCQVGFQADMPSIAQGQIVSNHGLINDCTSEIVELYSRDILPGLVTSRIPDCQTNTIQICDDDEQIIFLSDFECGTTDEWKAVVGEVLAPNP